MTCEYKKCTEQATRVRVHGYGRDSNIQGAKFYCTQHNAEVYHNPNEIEGNITRRSRLRIRNVGNIEGLLLREFSRRSQLKKQITESDCVKLNNGV